MAHQAVPFFACNRGEISRKALARVDVDKMRLAAEQKVNWMPMVMGPMTMRPGLGFTGEVYNDQPCRLLEFVKSTTDAALIELTDSLMRVWVNDALVTRAAVTGTIQAFASWTTSASTGATVDTSGSTLQFSGVRYNDVSSAYGAISVTAGETAIEHAVRIVISRGPILFKMGTTVGGEEILSSTSLDNGVHSIAFTPGVATVYCQFDSTKAAVRKVDSITIESAGVFTLPTSWTASKLDYVLYDQSADVVFVACRGVKQKRIERRSTTSWSIVDYRTFDGPFPSSPGDESFLFTSDQYEGDANLTCNKPFFTSGHVGAKMRLFHNRQKRDVYLSKENTYCRPFRVSGTYTATLGTSDRTFAYTIAGTWSGTITLERTYDPDGIADWAKIKTFTANTSTSFDDNLQNVIVWYRLGFLEGDYTSGSAHVLIDYPGGGGAGVCEIISITSSTVAKIEILDYLDSKGRHYGFFSNLAVSDNWRLSEWNGVSGYPSALGLHEGRLWHGGLYKTWGSVSDAFSSFDFEKTGDAAPIARSIGKGPVANINFMLSLSRLAIGADSGVITARSSSFDEPLTPTAFNLKYSTNQGSAPLRAIQIDNNGVYVQRSNRRVYLLSFVAQSGDFKPFDMTRLNLDIGIPGFVDIAVQRQPDTRLLLVRGDGQLAVLTYDEQDDVQAWWRIETNGVIERVAVLPGHLEDQVYVVVKRTIGGVTKRYIEKFARLDECEGGTTSKLADSHIVYSGGATSTISGLSHLEGKSVVVWGDGREIGFDTTDPSTVATYTVSGGSITLPTTVTNAVVGLPYEAQFVSAKLAYAAQAGTALNRVKRVDHVGFVLDKTHFQAIQFGHWHEDPAEQVLSDLPRIERGATTPDDTIWESYDQQAIPMSGEWDTDSRVTIVGQAPRPATVCGFSISINTSG